jgi:hypothetical protein
MLLADPAASSRTHGRAETVRGSAAQTAKKRSMPWPLSDRAKIIAGGSERALGRPPFRHRDPASR